jgi:hypothetical protein
MANGEKNEFKRRGSSRRRRTLQDDEKLVIPKEGVSAFWNNWGKNLVQTLFFGAAIIPDLGPWEKLLLRMFTVTAHLVF